jgi:hypothetical protein
MLVSPHTRSPLHAQIVKDVRRLGSRDLICITGSEHAAIFGTQQ